MTERPLTATVAAVGLAAVGAVAALATSSNVAYVVIALVGALVLLRSLTEATRQAKELAAIDQYITTLAPLTAVRDVLTEALGQSSALLDGSRAAVVVPPGATLTAGVYELVGGTLTHQCDAPAFMAAVAEADEPTLLAELLGGEGLAGAADGVAAPVRFDNALFQFMVWDRATAAGRFGAAELSLFAALMGQTQIAGQRAMLFDRLEHDAHHDALTGLPNRLGFSRRFDERVGTGLGTLFVIDLDRFKEINDTLGHATGDRALQVVAKRIDRIVGDGAIVGRIGGDEFVVFDPSSSDPGRAETFARRLAAAIGSPISLDDLSLEVGASIGVAIKADSGDDLATLLSHGDIAMYVAKAAQLRWHFYGSEDKGNKTRHLDLMTGLRAATELGELDVWYQPKMRLRDDTITGVEALVRWIHPRYGFVPPEEFVAIAEQGGMIRELTAAVAARAISDAGTWARQGMPLQVAVNLSMRNLLDDTLPDRLIHLLTVHDVAPELVAFEVTETVIMSDRDRVTAVLTRLREAGFELAIDDYGTGYSSLAYLRELPVDVLKIDRAFVSNLDIDTHNEVIVRSTVDLGHNLGLSVVAEGVERQPELEALRQLDCDHVQGYLLSRPLPLGRFNTWLSNRPAPDAIESHPS